MRDDHTVKETDGDFTTKRLLERRAGQRAKKAEVCDNKRDPIGAGC